MGLVGSVVLIGFRVAFRLSGYRVLEFWGFWAVVGLGLEGFRAFGAFRAFRLEGGGFAFRVSGLRFKV